MLNLLLLGMVSFSALATEQAKFETIRSEIPNIFKANPLAAQMVTKNADDLYSIAKVLNNKAQFIQKRREYHKSLLCVEFLLTQDEKDQFDLIEEKILGLSEMTGFPDKQDKVMGMPGVESQVYKDLEQLVSKESWKYCSVEIPQDLIAGYEERSVRKPKVVVLNHMPPTDPLARYRNPTLESYKEEAAKLYEKDHHVVKALHDIADYMPVLNAAYSDPVKYEAALEEKERKLYCVEYLLGNFVDTNMTDLRRIMDGTQEGRAAKMNEFEFSMKNRESYRRRKDKLETLPADQRHHYCAEKFSAKDLKAIKAKFAEMKKEDEKFQLNTYEDVPLMVRKNLLEMQKQFITSKRMRRSQVDQMVEEVFYGNTLPILEMIAQMKTLPLMKKNCPGKLETYWEKCKTNKFYGESKFSTLMPNGMKYLCLSEHKLELVPQCLAAHDLYKDE